MDELTMAIRKMQPTKRAATCPANRFASLVPSFLEALGNGCSRMCRRGPLAAS